MSDDVLLDSDGNPADRKAAFEIERKILGRVVKGVRYCSNEEYESGRSGATVMISFDDGGDLILAVPEPGTLEFYVSSKREESLGSGLVM